MTITEMLTLFETLSQETIQADGTVGAKITISQVLSLLNRGQEIFVEETDCIKTRSYITTTSGTQEYELPTNLIKILRVTYNNDRIYPASYDELDEHDRDWEDAGSSTPEYYYLKEVKNEKIIGLFKKPDSSTNVMEIWYVRKPTELTSSSTTIDIDTQHHIYLVYFAIAMFYLRDKDRTGQFEKFIVMFNGGIEKVKTKEKFDDYDKVDRVKRWVEDSADFLNVRFAGEYPNVRW